MYQHADLAWRQYLSVLLPAFSIVFTPLPFLIDPNILTILFLVVRHIKIVKMAAVDVTRRPSSIYFQWEAKGPDSVPDAHGLLTLSDAVSVGQLKLVPAPGTSTPHKHFQTTLNIIRHAPICMEHKIK